jgi:hypothetical protein
MLELSVLVDHSYLIKPVHKYVSTVAKAGLNDWWAQVQLVFTRFGFFLQPIVLSRLPIMDMPFFLQIDCD